MRLSLWAPVLAYMALIFVLSSRSVPPRLDRLVPDKIVHAGMYAGLSALLVRALAGGWRRPVSRALALAAAGLATLYGVSDEIHQAFVPSRHADWLDLVADAAGAAGAAVALYAWGIIQPRNAL